MLMEKPSTGICLSTTIKNVEFRVQVDVYWWWIIRGNPLSNTERDKDGISSIMSPLNPRHLVHLHLILPSVWSELKRTTFGLGSTLFVL